MANFDLMRRLSIDSGGKIILLVLDGVGGLPLDQAGQTELEAATTPNLDRLAREGQPIPALTPTRPRRHAAGYDPRQMAGLCSSVQACRYRLRVIHCPRGRRADYC